MDGMTRLNATVVSHVGRIRTGNDDNFYLNGRYSSNFEKESVQVSVEKARNEFIFTVCDGMEVETGDINSSISLVKELGKLQQNHRAAAKGIEYRLDQLFDCTEEVGNLICDMYYEDVGQLTERISTSGLLISGGEAAVIAVGSSSVYILRDGEVRQFPEESGKEERLARLGIIPKGKQDDPSQRFSSSASGERFHVMRTEPFPIQEGDVFLLCSDGLTGMVEENRIFKIISDSGNVDQAAALLVEEALKNGGEDNITVLLVQIEKVGTEAAKGRGLSGKEGNAYNIPVERKADQTLDNQHAAIGSKMSDKSGADKDDDQFDKRADRLIGTLLEKTMNDNASSSSSQSSYQHRHFNKLSARTKKRRKVIRQVVSTVVTLAVLSAVVYASFNWIISGASKNEDKEASNTNVPVTTPSNTPDLTETNNPVVTPEPEITPEPTPSETPAISDPKPIVHTVEKGETLSSISQKYYNTRSKYKLIMDENGLESENIVIGQKLKIPEIE